jgi:hypothetical protein
LGRVGFAGQFDAELAADSAVCTVGADEITGRLGCLGVPRSGSQADIGGVLFEAE